MNFEELEKRVGFGAAVVTLEKSLGPEFFEKLVFNQWKKIYDASSPGSKLRKTALIKMAEKAETLSQLYVVCFISPRGSELEKTTLDKIARVPASFEELFETYCKCPPGTELQKILLARIAEAKVIFSELLDPYVTTITSRIFWKTELQNVLSAKITEAIATMTNVDHLLEAYDEVTKYKKLSKFYGLSLVNPIEKLQQCILSRITELQTKS